MKNDNPSLRFNIIPLKFQAYLIKTKSILSVTSLNIFINNLRLIVILLFLYLALSIAFSSNLIQFIPDDGFYYLQLSKHFSHLGLWSFDGVNLTNGFHLLWAYLLSVISLFNPSIDMFPILGIFLSLVILSILIFVIGKDFSALPWLAFLVTTSSFVFNSIGLTEFCLVVTCSYFVITNKYAYIFAFLGVLSRTDFVIIPIVVFLIGIIFSRRYDFKLLISTGLGLTVFFLHSYLTTGTFIQFSALIKSDWAQYYGPALMHNKAIALTTNFFYCSNEFLFIVILIIGLILFFIKKDIDLITSLILILVYTALYWNYAGVQSWYQAMFFIPLFIIGKHLFSNKPIAYLLIMGILFNVFQSYSAPYPHQKIIKDAGKYLSQNKLNGRIASWNSGILGYYEGGNVINLDGLVNNNIYPYIKNNNVLEYLKKEKIKYIADFSNMYTGIYPEQGGYNSDFLSNIKPIMIFDHGEYWWKYFVIVEIIPWEVSRYEL